MSPWLTYLRERSPVAPLLMLGGGAALSGAALGHHGPHLVAVLVASAGLLLFFVLARLMDERKDHEKDKIAHPERPVPRGLLSLEQVERAIVTLEAAGFLLALVLGALAGPVVGLLYALTMAWLWLMYKEFYVGARLADFPIVYAVTHQVVMFPLLGFAVAVSSPAETFSRAAVGFYLANLGAGMAYEIARKLDPKADPVLKTYLSLLGRGPTVAWAAAFLALSAVGAWLLGLSKWLWPVDAYVAIALSLVFAAPQRFKLVEGAAAIGVMLNFWSVFIAYEAGWWT